MLGACVDGLLTVLLCLIMMEKDVYILTIRENVIIRYVEVMLISHLFPCVLWAFQSIFGYNSCVRAYNISHSRSLDNNTFYHLVLNWTSSEAIYSCVKKRFLAESILSL